MSENPALETSVRKAVEADIVAAINKGLIDATTDSAAVATVLGLADSVDYLAANGGLNIEGKFDNVSVPTLLRYLSALNLTPNGRAVNAGKIVAAKGGGVSGAQRTSKLASISKLQARAAH